MTQRRTVRTRRPLTEWETRSPEARLAIVRAPFPLTKRYPGKTWAGVIVVDEMDDPLTRYRPKPSTEGDGTVDNLYRTMEG